MGAALPLSAAGKPRGLPAPGQLRLPPLYPKQAAAMFEPKRFSIIEASTKSGKTASAIVWLLGQAWEGGRPGANYWWVAPIFAQAKIAFDRIKRGLQVSRGVVYNQGEMTITLPNGAVLWFKSGDKPDSLYGDDVVAVVVDEATRCKEAAWTAVFSTLTATGGRARIIGNVRGRKNWVHRLALRAKAGDPDLAFHKLTAYDAVDGGVLSRKVVETARRLLPADVFRELYMAEPSDDGGNPFSLAAIEACLAPALSKKPAVAFGVDLAKSSDWTVVVGLDEDGAACVLERWQGPWNLTIERLRAMLATCKPSGWGGRATAFALIDSTGVGDPIVEQVGVEGGIEGFKFSSQSKQSLMEGLAAAIHQRAVAYPDGVLRDELDAFEYAITRTGVRYAAPEGLHDDCVCALALAVRAFSRKPAAPVYAGTRGAAPGASAKTLAGTRAARGRHTERTNPRGHRYHLARRLPTRHAARGHRACWRAAPLRDAKPVGRGLWRPGPRAARDRLEAPPTRRTRV